MSGDILTVKTVKRVRSVRGSALVHIMMYVLMKLLCYASHFRAKKYIYLKQYTMCLYMLHFYVKISVFWL